MTLQVIDQSGNKTDYDVASVPRIGDRIVLGATDTRRSAPLCYRVVDVIFRLDAPTRDQVAVLVEEDEDSGMRLA
jgi:hypothetical protein